MKPFFAHGGTFVLALAILALAGCGSGSTDPYGGGNPPPPTDPNTIVISGMSYTPASKTITAGTTITWKNNDGVVHSSTSNTGVWDTGAIPAGGSRTATFNTPGTFPYHCTYHSGMSGTIVVQ
jgi:plastocyanin